MLVIGVLALQGAFQEHANAVNRLGAAAAEVRLPTDVSHLDGLIIPGGESTTIARLIGEFGLRQPIRDLIHRGTPVLGTCAGMILLARKSTGLPFDTFGAIDIEVKRNAYGRQINSFEIDLNMNILGIRSFPGIFIRAPIITEIGQEVTSVCSIDGAQTVAARQNNILVTAFHPELTDDSRFHEYFLNMARGD